MLKFYDEGHVYEYDGVVIPSVSELLRFLSREVYGDIDKFTLDHAAERGTAVHAATEELDKTGSVEVPDDCAGYIEAYARFRKEHKADWLYIEKPIAHPGFLFAGTIDRAGEVDGTPAILDIKTTATVKKSLVKAQLNGYKLLTETIGFKPVKLFCLQLLKTGKYRLYEATIDNTEFMACLNLHRAMTRKHKRGKIE